MMNSMYTTGMYGSAAAFGSIHALAALAAFAGFVLLLAWAIKSLPAAQLKQWGLWLLVGGIIVSLLSFGAVAVSRGGMMQGTRMMRGLVDDDDVGSTYGGMMRRDADDGMGMSMNGMNAMLRGKTGDDFDEAFLRMMIPHHQGAIDMAKAAQASAKHQEIKDMADDIVSAQQREIDRMNGWLKDWGYED